MMTTKIKGSGDNAMLRLTKTVSAKKFFISNPRPFAVAIMFVCGLILGAYASITDLHHGIPADGYMAELPSIIDTVFFAISAIFSIAALILSKIRDPFCEDLCHSGRMMFAAGAGMTAALFFL